MFSVTHPAPLTHSSEQIELLQAYGENADGHHFEAKVHHTFGQDPASARAILGRDDNRMRVHIRNVGSPPEARPMTPRLQFRARWLAISRTAQDQRTFLNDWQSGRRVELVDEDALSTAIAAETARGCFTASDVDQHVAFDLRATCSGSFGAGSSIIGFLGGRTSTGLPIVASIHKNVTEAQPLTPETAFAEIVGPLEAQVAEALAQIDGSLLTEKSFYFAGGNAQTLESCAALALTAEKLELNVPYSMLGANFNGSYMNAMLGVPAPVAPNGVFFVARVDAGSNGG